jgi:hypothetical protein
MDYLRNIQQAFEAILSEITASPAFQAWINATVAEQTNWPEFVNSNLQFSLAVMRYQHRSGGKLPEGAVTPAEAAEPMTIEDWVLLLEKYGLNVLKLSENSADHQVLARLRKAILPFGFTLTERGLRQGRSAGDLVLAFSESKDSAVADILRFEQQAMRDQLRAVVITDFEQMSSGVRRLRDVLEPDAGSAIRLFRHIAEQPGLASLNPILVTGSNLMITSKLAQQTLADFEEYFARHRLTVTLTPEDTASPAAMAVRGTGKDWGPRIYVPMVTNLLDMGSSHCLVGTRGLLGEGWDSITLNTLIDLTSVTTSTSVQQLRGRDRASQPLLGNHQRDGRGSDFRGRPECGRAD